MGTCLGTNNEHCCWLRGKVCVFLEEDTVPGRRWACGLYRELGSWDAVHADLRYLTTIKPILTEMGLTVDCGGWPPPGETCATCGEKG